MVVSWEIKCLCMGVLLVISLLWSPNFFPTTVYITFIYRNTHIHTYKHTHVHKCLYTHKPRERNITWKVLHQMINYNLKSLFCNLHKLYKNLVFWKSHLYKMFNYVKLFNATVSAYALFHFSLPLTWMCYIMWCPALKTVL